MGYWKTTVENNKPKHWTKPNCRWKIKQTQDEAIIDFNASGADFAELAEDPESVELSQQEMRILSQQWQNPPWEYPTAEERRQIGYCSIADLRARGITVEAATDEELGQAVCMAAVSINAFCNREFYRRKQTYHVDGDNKQVLFLEDRPIVRILDLKIDGLSVSGQDISVYEEEGYIKPGRSRVAVFPQGDRNIAITGLFGFDPIPPEVHQACLLLAINALREIRQGINLEQADGNSTRHAIGIKRAKVEDISIEYEYPSSVKQGVRSASTGLSEADAILFKYKRELEAAAV